MGREDLLPRVFQVEPLRPIDLGELLLGAAAGRPLDRFGVAGQRRRVEIGFGGPGFDDFPGPLPDRAELDQLLEVELGRLAQLLFELADRAGARLLLALDPALRNRPGPGVSFRPERPARMDEEELSLAAAAAEEEDPGAAFCRHRRHATVAGTR